MKILEDLIFNIQQQTVKLRNELLRLYLVNVEAYCSWTKVKDDFGNETDPDESLMREIEEQVGISEQGKKVFREEILIRISTYERRGKKFNIHSHSRLQDAIDGYILNVVSKAIKDANEFEFVSRDISVILEDLNVNRDIESAKKAIIALADAYQI